MDIRKNLLEMPEAVRAMVIMAVVTSIAESQSLNYWLITQAADRRLQKQMSGCYQQYFYMAAWHAKALVEVEINRELARRTQHKSEAGIRYNERANYNA